MDIPRTYPNATNNYSAKNQAKLSPAPKRLSLEALEQNAGVGYYETDQCEPLSSKYQMVDIAALYQVERDAAGDSTIDYVHYEDFTESEGTHSEAYVVSKSHLNHPKDDGAKVKDAP